MHSIDAVFGDVTAEVSPPVRNEFRMMIEIICGREEHGVAVEVARLMCRRDLFESDEKLAQRPHTIGRHRCSELCRKVQLGPVVTEVHERGAVFRQQGIEHREGGHFVARFV